MMRVLLSLTLAVACYGFLGLGPTHPSAQAAPAKAEANKTGIEWKVEPAEVIVHLDGKKLGKAADLKFTTTAPGRHTILLVNGGDEEELEVKVNKGQTLRVEYTFSE